MIEPDVLNGIIPKGLKEALDIKLRDNQAGFKQHRSCSDEITTLRN